MYVLSRRMGALSESRPVSFHLRTHYKNISGGGLTQAYTLTTWPYVTITLALTITPPVTQAGPGLRHQTVPVLTGNRNGHARYGAPTR